LSSVTMTSVAGGNAGNAGNRPAGSMPPAIHQIPVAPPL
jgi:hypothetical protein